MNTENSKNLFRDRQKPLAALYNREPAAAWIQDSARTAHAPDDPLHSHVTIGPAAHSALPIGVHTAVGGDGDAVVPGDLLAAALASCVDTTLRVIANRMSISIQRLEVNVRAGVDVRGTLLVDPRVPVGFQRLTVDLLLECDADDATRRRLVQLAEHCCVVLRTLRGGVEVDLSLSKGARHEEADHVPA